MGEKYERRILYCTGHRPHCATINFVSDGQTPFVIFFCISQFFHCAVRAVRDAEYTENKERAGSQENGELKVKMKKVTFGLDNTGH